jgi:hypothetical protein
MKACDLTMIFSPYLPMNVTYYCLRGAMITIIIKNTCNYPQQIFRELILISAFTILFGATEIISREDALANCRAYMDHHVQHHHNFPPPTLVTTTSSTMEPLPTAPALSRPPGLQDSSSMPDPPMYSVPGYPPTYSSPSNPLGAPSAQPQDALAALISRLGFAVTLLENPYAATQELKPLAIAEVLRIFQTQVVVVQRQISAQEQQRFLETAAAEVECGMENKPGNMGKGMFLLGEEPEENMLLPGELKQSQRKGAQLHKDEMNEEELKAGGPEELDSEEGEVEDDEIEEEQKAQLKQEPQADKQGSGHPPKDPPKFDPEKTYRTALQALYAIESNTLPPVHSENTADITYLKAYIQNMYSIYLEKQAAMLKLDHGNTDQQNQEPQKEVEDSMDLKVLGTDIKDDTTFKEKPNSDAQTNEHTSHQTNPQADLEALETKYQAKINELKTKHAAQMSFLKTKVDRLGDENALLKSWSKVEQPNEVAKAYVAHPNLKLQLREI